jgi:hypothetical protein
VGSYDVEKLVAAGGPLAAPAAFFSREYRLLPAEEVSVIAEVCRERSGQRSVIAEVCHSYSPQKRYLSVENASGQRSVIAEVCLAYAACVLVFMPNAFVVRCGCMRAHMYVVL